MARVSTKLASFKEGRRNPILAAVCQDKRGQLESNWEDWAERAGNAGSRELPEIQRDALAIPMADIIEYAIWTAQRILKKPVRLG